MGDFRESIVVTGATPVIERASASFGMTLDRAALETLPNPGRNPFVLAAGTPAVMPTGNPQFVRMQDQNQASMLAVAGGPRRANSYKLDGVPIEDLFSRAALIPSIEAVEEVRVQATAYDAEAGRSGGDPACLCVRWLNPAAWTAAPVFTFGDQPRADPDARTPGRANWDVAVQKTIGLARARLSCAPRSSTCSTTRGSSGP